MPRAATTSGSSTTAVGRAGRRAPSARRSRAPGRPGSSALRTGPEGGSRSLRLRRISERWTSARSSAVPGVWRATAPKTQASPRATATISAAPPAPSRAWSDRGRGSTRSAEAEGDALERHRDERSDQQRPERGEQRRVGRLGAVAQQQRPEPAPGDRAADEADQGQGADDQPLAVAPDPHRHGEGDDPPIEHGHG